MKRHLSYDKAVRNFSAIMDAVLQTTTNSPRELSRMCDIPSATTYRIVATLEKLGFIERDASSLLAIGPSASQTGFSAWRKGWFAGSVRPVVIDLRRNLQLTSFAGFLTWESLSVGTFSMGRGPQYFKPSSSYGYDLPSQTHAPEQPYSTARLMLPGDKDHLEFHAAFISTEPDCPVCQLVLGVLSRTKAQLQGTQIQQALTLSRDRLNIALQY